jgi:AcrR family transcriptional regulator
MLWTDMSVQRLEDRKLVKRGLFLEAARKIFARKGFAGTNVSDIVAEVSSGQGTFYYHFKDKQAIFDELMIGFVEQLVRTVIENGSSSIGKPALADRALAIENARNIASVFLNNRDIARLFFLESKYLGGEAATCIEQLYTLFYSQIEQGFEEGKSLGLVRPELDSKIAARCFIGATERVIFEAVKSEKPVEDIGLLVEQIVDFQSVGILSFRSDIARDGSRVESHKEKTIN